MNNLPMKDLLRGLSMEKAEMYGKPHIMCHYGGTGVNTYRLDDGARCVCCGRPAENAHHCPPKGTSPTFTLHGHVLRPSLFAVCGSGTTGCHGGFHSLNRFTVRWEWDGETEQEMWWRGELLEEYGPHSPMLYNYGEWVFTDKKTGRVWEYKEIQKTLKFWL